MLAGLTSDVSNHVLNYPGSTQGCNNTQVLELHMLAGCSMLMSYTPRKIDRISVKGWVAALGVIAALLEATVTPKVA